MKLFKGLLGKKNRRSDLRQYHVLRKLHYVPVIFLSIMVLSADAFPFEECYNLSWKWRSIELRLVKCQETEHQNLLNVGQKFDPQTKVESVLLELLVHYYQASTQVVELFSLFGKQIGTVII